MKFKGTGTVWNPYKKCPLVRFGKESIVDVKDEETIDMLIEFGYKPLEDFIDVAFEEVEEVDFEGMTKNQLYEYIEENGGNVSPEIKRLNKKDLIDLVEKGFFYEEPLGES
jgi:hypothetical protein